MKRSHGFTLVELMVTVAIVAILMATAAPSFSALVKSAHISSAVSNFNSDIRFARSESMRRGASVVMCRSNAPEAATPSCDTSAGPGGAGWVTGWIIFADHDRDGEFSAGDTVLRVQGSTPGAGKITEGSGTFTSSSKFKFTAMGRFRDAGSNATMLFGDGAAVNQRVVCVSISGRARIAGDGNSVCS